MFEAAKVFLLHTCAHVFLYRIPRWLHQLFIRLPVTLWELISGKRPLTYRRQRERHIKVVASATDAEASRRLLHTFGLEKNMTYDGPLYHGDIHTVLGVLMPSRRVQYTRELLEAADGNPICLDWLKVPPGKPVKGIIFIVPGVGNYGQTPYIQRLVRLAQRSGLHCCILTPRGMGSAPLTKPQLPCLTFTSDIRTTLRQRFQRRRILQAFGEDLPLFLLGYSGGGTTLTKAVVEESEALAADPTLYAGGFPVQAVVCMNAPYNMFVHTDTVLHGAFFYQKPMVTAMQKYALKHIDVLKDGLPGLPSITSRGELLEYFDELKTVRDFNHRVIAPHFGYEDEAAYYEDAAAFKWLRRTDAVIPFICVAAKGDPITGDGHSVEEWQELVDQHHNIVYVETPVGGHLSYLPGPLDELRERGSFLIDFPIELILRATKGSVGKSATEGHL